MVKYYKIYLNTNVIKTANEFSEINKSDYKNFIKNFIESFEISNPSIRLSIKNLKKLGFITEDLNSRNRIEKDNYVRSHRKPLFIDKARTVSELHMVNDFKINNNLKKITKSISIANPSIRLAMEDMKKLGFISKLPKTYSIVESAYPNNNKVKSIKNEAEVNLNHFFNARNVLRNPQKFIENPFFLSNLFYYWNTPILNSILNIIVEHCDLVSQNDYFEILIGIFTIARIIDFLQCKSDNFDINNQ